MRRLGLLALATFWIAEASPALAGTCTSLADCSQNNVPVAALVLIALPTLLGLVCFLALDGAFGPAPSDEFAPADADELATAPATSFARTPARGVEPPEELAEPGADPEFGPDRLFLRPPKPKEGEAPAQSLFRADGQGGKPGPAKPEVSEDEKFAATAQDRDAFDDKLDGLAKAYKPDDADYAKVAVTLDDNGRPTDGSINYFNRRFDNSMPIYKVSVDAEGDPVGAASTAAGRAFQALQGFMPEGPATVKASYAQDKDGNTYIDRVRVTDEHDVLRADLQFNEHGQAWFGQRFDADAKRTGVLDNPDMAPGAPPPPDPTSPPDADNHELY
jgi:hypothetical protein